MKAVLTKIRSGEEASPRSFKQMGEVGIALKNFVESGGKENAWSYWTEGGRNCYSMCVEDVGGGLVRVVFDSGRTKYYRIIKKEVND